MEGLRKDVKEASAYSHAAAVLAALALLVALFGSATTLRVAQRANHAADDSRATARQLAGLVESQRRELIARQVLSHKLSLKSCRSRHQLAGALVVTLTQSQATTRRLLADGTYDAFGPKVKQAVIDSLAQSQTLLGNLHKADCDPSNPKDVLPLPKNTNQ